MSFSTHQKIITIIPAFNEEFALRECVLRLLAAMPTLDVLIVNDGSLDCTGHIARELSRDIKNVRYVTLPLNSGIGIAVQTGLIFAKRNAYDFAIQYDGDGQHEPRSIPDLITKTCTENLDLCVGSRFLSFDPENFHSTRLRRFGIRFFSWLIGTLTEIHVTDPTSGFRVYGKRAIDYFSRHYPDDYPEPEVLFWCARNGLRVGEVAVHMRERLEGESSIRYLRTVYYMVKVTIAILLDRIRSRETR